MDFYVVLHPSTWLAYFEDKSKWDPTIANHARTLLAHIFEVYKAETAPTTRSKPTTPASPSKLFFMEAIRSLNPEQLQAAAGELEHYFSGTYPSLGGNFLAWWKVCEVFIMLVSQLTVNHASRKKRMSFLYSREWLMTSSPSPVSASRLSTSSQAVSTPSPTLGPP